VKTLFDTIEQTIYFDQMATETKAAMSADTTTAIPRRAVEIIPGTEIMADIGNSHLAKAGGNGSVYVDSRRVIHYYRTPH
jgi:hypothetical protein